jgi:hypothetical protein
MESKKVGNRRWERVGVAEQASAVKESWAYPEGPFLIWRGQSKGTESQRRATKAGGFTTYE